MVNTANAALRSEIEQKTREWLKKGNNITFLESFSDEYITIKDICERYMVTEGWVKKQIKASKFPRSVNGNTNGRTTLLFSSREISAFMAFRNGVVKPCTYSANAQVKG